METTEKVKGVGDPTPFNFVQRKRPSPSRSNVRHPKSQRTTFRVEKHLLVGADQGASAFLITLVID